MEHNLSAEPQPPPTSCDLEQIQFTGRIQSHAALLELSTDWIVTRASQNAGVILGHGPGELLGRPLTECFGREAVHDIRAQLQIAGITNDAVGRAFDLTLVGGRPAFDISVHRTEGSIVLELEPSRPDDQLAMAQIQPLIGQLRGKESVAALLSRVPRQVQAITGFERVLIYRFHEDGSGEVIAEAKKEGLDPFLSLRYPASDIPRQARKLYERNTIRLIADVADETVPVVPALDPRGLLLDLSLAASRAVSPFHIEYLRNMGVASSLSISLMVDGRLWGLIACHGTQPRVVSARRRGALEFYGQIVSSMLESRLRGVELERQRQSRELHRTLLARFSSEGTGLRQVMEGLATFDLGIRADGFAAFIDGQLHLEGTTPREEEVVALMRFLNRTEAGLIFDTDQLSAVYPEAAAYVDLAAGVLAVPVSRKPRDFVVFFRQELVRCVTWAGEPTKIVRDAGNGPALHPRASFAAWRETVRGRCEAWSEGDRAAAEALRVSLLELLLRATVDAERQRKQSNEQQDILIAELNHRVRNILGLIVGLVRQCRDGASTMDMLASDISQRVQALARAHDQITRAGWGPRSLKAMIRVEASAYLGPKAERVRIAGEDVGVQPAAFSTMALVMHELITNSAKYGAFRDSHGSVDVVFSRTSGGDLELEWRESGGAPIAPPTRRGFGSTLIERAIPHELSGTVALDFRPEGLLARFLIPAGHVSAIAESMSPEPGEQARPGPEGAMPGHVLLVEDNLLIAMETEEVLERLGVSKVSVASTVDAALQAVVRERPDFAILDFNLGRETSAAVAEELKAQTIPFIFATGYGDANVIPGSLRQGEVLTKPYGSSDLQQILRQNS